VTACACRAGHTQVSSLAERACACVWLGCRHCTDLCFDVIKRFKGMSARLLHRPADSTELVNCEGVFDSAAETDLPALEKEAIATRQLLDFLLRYEHSISEETLVAVHTTFEWVHKMDGVMQSCSELLTKYVGRLSRGRVLATMLRCGACIMNCLCVCGWVQHESPSGVEPAAVARPRQQRHAVAGNGHRSVSRAL
jgi:hypothetical protein